jgi:hypothetical protein
MERLKITEAIANHKPPMDWPKFLDEVFPDDEPGKGRMGNKPLLRSRKRTLITYWDRGEHLTRCHPRHIKRIADYFGIKLLCDIVEVTKA